MKRIIIFAFTVLTVLLLSVSCSSNKKTSDNGTQSLTGTTSVSTITENTPCVTHTFGEWTLVKKAECTKDGESKRICTVCSYKETEIIPKTGHTEVVIEAIESTCSAEGKTDGKRCSVCTRITKIPVAVEKKPHVFDNGVCTVCNAPEQSEGLGFKLSSDGTYYIAANSGSCKDSHVILPAVYQGLPVKEIGEEYYMYNTTIVSISIPDSITKVDSTAFDRCANLTYNTYDNGLYLGNSQNPYLVLMKLQNQNISAMEIHEDTKIIATTVFKKCKNLTEIVIPEGVTAIEKGTFEECTSLKKVTIEGQMKYIETWAFGNCSSLESINLPDSITNLGYSAFIHCSSLKEIILPRELTFISSDTFSGCSSLESIVIPDKVTYIGSYAFDGCSSIKSIVIGDALESFTTDVFTHCSSAKSITLGSSFRTMTYLYEDTMAFFRFGAFEEFVVAKDNPYLSSKDGVIYNKDMTTLICYPAHKNAKSFTIPSSVTQIANHGFYHCTALESVILPVDLKIISIEAFKNCTELKSVIFPEKLEEIQSGAFSGCTKLTDVSLPDSIMLIWNNSFIDCGISYTIEGICEYLGNNENPYLVLMNIKAYSSDSIITVNSRTKVIAARAAYSCNTINTVILPEGLVSICDTVFALCSNLSSISIPSSVVYIGNSAFNQCSSLTEIVLPEGITFIGNKTFEYCSSLTSITLPNSVLYIGENAFGQCRALTEVILSENLETIAAHAFHYCKALKEIIIPASVTSVDEDAFTGCDGIKIIYN